jgi:hypothetical protein
MFDRLWLTQQSNFPIWDQICDGKMELSRHLLRKFRFQEVASKYGILAKHPILFKTELPCIATAFTILSDDY